MPVTRQYEQGVCFTAKYKITFKSQRPLPPSVPKRDVYLVRNYDYPTQWEEMTSKERLDRLAPIRLCLRNMGEAEKDMVVFSFWQYTIMVKAVDNPAAVDDYLQKGQVERLSADAPGHRHLRPGP